MEVLMLSDEFHTSIATFFINNSTLVFEHLSPSSFHSKQQVQHSVVDVASFLFQPLLLREKEKQQRLKKEM